jgi:hypothetical protein
MTNSDRDLLELAAAAADMRVGGWALDKTKGMRLQDGYGDFLRFWNPLRDDADNRQLQVQLKLALIPCEGGGWDAVSYDSETYEEKIVVSGVEPNRAVVTAAAIIGKNKQDLE